MPLWWRFYFRLLRETLSIFYTKISFHAISSILFSREHNNFLRKKTYIFIVSVISEGAILHFYLVSINLQSPKTTFFSLDSVKGTCRKWEKKVAVPWHIIFKNTFTKVYLLQFIYKRFIYTLSVEICFSKEHSQWSKFYGIKFSSRPLWMSSQSCTLSLMAWHKKLARNDASIFIQWKIHRQALISVYCSVTVHNIKSVRHKDLYSDSQELHAWIQTEPSVTIYFV